MNTAESSATAYEQLSTLTERYTEGQARLQELRVLTRALRTITGRYSQPGVEHDALYRACLTMFDAASIERNRLYVEGSRLAEEMERLNGLIQNGAFNEVR